MGELLPVSKMPIQSSRPDANQNRELWKMSPSGHYPTTDTPSYHTRNGLERGALRRERHARFPPPRGADELRWFVA